MQYALGYRWITAPPPSAGGFTMVQSLAILQRRRRGRYGYATLYAYALIRSWKGPFLDRERYFGDPDCVDFATRRVVDTEAKIDKRAELFQSKHSTESSKYSLPIEETNPNIQQPG
ncbi:MAG: gamma-glutamyltransferase [Polyangiales bacterium]